MIKWVSICAIVPIWWRDRHSDETRAWAGTQAASQQTASVASPCRCASRPITAIRFRRRSPMLADPSGGISLIGHGNSRRRGRTHQPVSTMVVSRSEKRPCLFRPATAKLAPAGYVAPPSEPQLTVNGGSDSPPDNISFGHGVHAGIHRRSDTDVDPVGRGGCPELFAGQATRQCSRGSKRRLPRWTETMATISNQERQRLVCSR